LMRASDFQKVPLGAYVIQYSHWQYWQ